jgi:Flp pilus assembly protein TadG
MGRQSSERVNRRKPGEVRARGDSERLELKCIKSNFTALGRSLLTERWYGYRAKLRSGLDVGNLKTERGALRRRIGDALKRRVGQGARDDRGAVAIIFAFAVVVLVPMVLGLFDLYTASEQKARLQDAIDAAALYAARSELTDDDEINELATRALTANLKLIRGATLVSANFRLTDDDTTVIGTATIKPLAIAPALFPHHNVSVGTEVVRNSRNLEVALVLDVTGSMTNGTRIADLRVAAQDLVDLVVKDQQTPFYSKVAVVPWSMGVNVGTYANNVRGTPVGGKAISGIAAWHTGSQRTISSVTRANPAVVTTSSNHGFVTGDTVMVTAISGSSNMDELNGAVSTITRISNTQIRLNGINSSSYDSYSGSTGRVTKCVRTDCRMVVTSTSHGLSDGEYVFIDGVSPSSLDTILDNTTYQVNGVATNTFNILVTAGPTAAYTSGGASYCTRYGCQFYRFQNAESPSRTKMFQASTCVSERTGDESLTDAAPSTAFVGFSYPPVNTDGTQWEGTAVSDANTPNPCLTNQIVPLSTDREGIKSMIGGLQAAGSTAGQIGTAWGWYMVSPEFAYLWPNAEQKPALYTKPDTIKVVVVMTDGALNSPYCNGVIARDALSGSGSYIDHNDCNATNGSTFTQALALCGAMRDAGVKVYTVGFQIGSDTTAQNFVNGCADDPDHVYMPTTGSQLKEAFKAIGAELNNLRLSK